MIAPWVFGLVAVAQGVFLFLLVIFLLIRRQFDRSQHAAFSAARSALSIPLRNWIVGGEHPDPVMRALRELPRGTAIGFVSLLAQQTVPSGQLDELADALRGEPWIRQAITRRNSRFWWRRLQAARALSIVGTPRDREAVALLLRDEHPAVQIAAASALPRVADVHLLEEVLEGLFTYPKVVRHYFTTVLRQTRGIAGAALARRIREGDEMPDLTALISLAGAIDDPTAISAALMHAEHPDAPVRRVLARTLARLPAPDATKVLVRLVGDHAPTVRAAAARALGELGAGSAAPVLAPLLRDPVWIVRYRSALALAQIGERGRAALRESRDGSDRFAAEMAAMVSGLSDSAVFELADA